MDLLTDASHFMAAGLLSLGVSLAIVQTRGLHLGRTARGHAGEEIQSTHARPTPRIGGLALMLGLLLSVALSSGEVRDLLLLANFACLPVFLAGMMEDLNFGASPRIRLMAAMLSSAMMILLSGYRISAVGVPGIDNLVALAPVGIAFTVFATAGVSHAYNLVDGLNGLSMGIAVVSATALGVIAASVGDSVLVSIAAAFILCVLGVFVVNYPFGWLFLGDGGAYTIGHLIAWLAVMLMARNPEVSPWAVLLTAFWPVMDTFAAILRRWINRTPTDAPDRMHFHHVMMRLILANFPVQHRLVVANSLATALMFPLFVTPAVLAVLTAQNNLLGFLSFVVCIIGYVGFRLALVRRFRAVRRRLMRLKSVLVSH
ncbi:glycosyltransferase [Aquicoccus sp. SU-CL01552]|uniref:MraY family glycosyltransferase n=1 Tax=Aquicoccus sp. SU-CL01552 TaxID=3127656 RepID=UPI0031068C5A